MVTCKRCKDSYKAATNDKAACRYHAREYVCRYHPNERTRVTGATDDDGLGYYGNADADGWPAKFWDCCGNEDPHAPGCVTDKHRSYDD